MLLLDLHSSDTTTYEHQRELIVTNLDHYNSSCEVSGSANLDSHILTRHSLIREEEGQVKRGTPQVQ